MKVIRLVVLFIIVFTFSMDVSKVSAQHNFPNTGNTALVIWKLGYDLGGMLENEMRGISHEDRYSNYFTMGIGAKLKLDLELPPLPEFTPDNQKNVEILLIHLMQKEVPVLIAAIQRKYGLQSSGIFVSAFYLRLLTFLYGTEKELSQRFLGKMKEALKGAGVPHEIWSNTVTALESDMSFYEANEELLSLHDRIFDHLLELEGLQNTTRFVQVAETLWQIALDWWEWALRHANGESSEAIVPYRLAAENAAKQIDISLRVVTIKHKDPEKNRLGALSGLATMRPFVGLEIEKKYGLRARWLFEFALEAQYLRITNATYRDHAQRVSNYLVDAGPRARLPEHLWDKVIEASTNPELNRFIIQNEILKMNNAIKEYLKDLKR